MAVTKYVMLNFEGNDRKQISFILDTQTTENQIHGGFIYVD